MIYDFKPNPNATVAETIKDFFNYLDADNYKPTDKGCNAIYDEWMRNKVSRFDKAFKDIEGYDPEAHAIILDTKYYRKTNPSAIMSFFCGYVESYIYPCKELVYDGKTLYEWRSLRDDLSVLLSRLNRVRKYVNPHMYEGIVNEYNATDKYMGFPRYDSDEVKLKRNEIDFCELMKCYTSQFINDNCAERINALFPKAKVVAGATTSRVVRKILTKHFRKSFNDIPEFESKYAKYSDAINPIEIPRKTIISWHIMDFFTMSFGVNWTSCMTPDKGNKHEYTGHTAGYHGCYSSGTESYGLDNVSLVVYTVKSDAQKPYWNLPKIDRQMFHISDNRNTIIQGRYYPYDQGDAGNNADYKEYEPNRLIIQSIVSKAYGLNNLWKNKQDTDNCCDFIDESYGTHYRDYENYSNCNVSFQPETHEYLTIGHDPICPSCGIEHDDNDWCTCYSCRNDKVCANCREHHDTDDMYSIDGEYYCENYSFFCNYDGQREVGERYMYIRDYGNVCEDGFNALIAEGSIHQDAWNEAWFYGECYYTATNNETGEVYFFNSTRHRANWMRDHSDISVTVND